ncbi:WD40 repeat-like protein [Auricularia subglabra TFB-10046 SS5]|uniref:WD40 repeat-like protein n=1 Tax=Auricularia subglabra (strain TFB-10046 / SS5) TaxID=717982 RepID=J0D304_AURST|nr:WD40 repeat-like protein [Auricularia subglabra TFB-10046 SS5]
MVPPTKPAYELWFSTSSHNHPISFVTFSSSGELLASGDDDGRVFIWSLGSGQCFQELRCPKPVISCCWGDDKELFIGCGNGEIHFFEFSVSQNRYERNGRIATNESNQHVTGLSIHGNRLAACSGNVVHCFTIEPIGLNPMQSWVVDRVREMRSVHFLDRQTILSASLREGVCVLLDVADGNRPLWYRKLNHRIGESAVSPDCRFFVATDLAGSVKMYLVTPTGLRQFRTFSSPVDMARNCPFQVCFAEDQSLLVSGSGCGEVRIWNVQTGKKTVLMHGRPKLAPAEDNFQLTQAVGAYSTLDSHLLASACSENNKKYTVKIWKRAVALGTDCDRKALKTKSSCEVEDRPGLFLLGVVLVLSALFGALYLINPALYALYNKLLTVTRERGVYYMQGY